nr:hypothetical protein [Candidatus Freyarchaeota archaeon]
MRIDSTAEKTYNTALSAIRETLGVEIRECRLFLVEKKALPELKPDLKEKPHILNYVRGFYDPKKDTIFIVSGYEEDLQTILHETLHSNSCLHSTNTPYWVYEGLTEALTEHILTMKGLSYSENLLISEEMNFWRRVFQAHKEMVIEAYFSRDPEKCYATLEEVTGIRSLKNKDFREL